MLGKVRSVKLNDIQWLRAIAALEVVVWHSDLVSKHLSSFSLTGLAWYRPFGGIGVELFFIVSGYVMCLRAPSYTSGIDFLYARIARLFPMYWIFTSLVIVAYLVRPQWRLNHFDLNVHTVLLSYLTLPQRPYPILGVGWTLEHEMIFYTTLALLLTVATTLVRPPSRSVALLLAAAGTAGFALGTGPIARVWDFHLLSPYMLLFGFGWAMCRAATLGERRAVLKTLAAAMAIWIVAFLLAEPSDYYLLYRMACAAAVFMLARAVRSTLQIDHPINNTVSIIADASYSLYLSHWLILSGLGKAFGALHVPALLDLPLRLAAIILCIVVAVGCFRYLEGPIDQFLRPRSPVANRAGPERSAQPVQIATRLSNQD